MSTQITLGTNEYTLISLPSSPGLDAIDVTMEDAVAVVPSPFVPSQAQTQAWPGADGWSMTITLPKMARAVAANWRGFMAELRGMQNVFQIGDPLCKKPLGAAKGAPVCATSGTNNLTSATSLYTSGWTPNIYRQLLAGDYLQIGYRLHMVCESVNSDASGNATISIFPSLRDSPVDGTAIILTNTVGVFRLAANDRTWHNDGKRLMQVSYKCREAR